MVGKKAERGQHLEPGDICKIEATGDRTEMHFGNSIVGDRIKILEILEYLDGGFVWCRVKFLSGKNEDRITCLNNVKVEKIGHGNLPIIQITQNIKEERMINAGDVCEIIDIGKNEPYYSENLMGKKIIILSPDPIIRKDGFIGCVIVKMLEDAQGEQKKYKKGDLLAFDYIKVKRIS